MLSVSMCVLSVSMCVLSVSIISVSMVSVSMVSVTYTLHIGYISVTYKGVGYVPRMLTSVTYIKVKSLRDFRVGFLFFSREFGFNVRFRFQTGT